MLIKNVKAETKKQKSNQSKKPKKIDPNLVRIMNSINKKFGNNAVKIGSEIVEDLEVERIPTGSIELDICLGGGIPTGRYSQIEGAYSSTKTTQTGHIVGKAQKMGLVCAWFDAEGTTDKAYLESLGVDTDMLLFVRPDGMEECTQMIIEMQRSGEVHLAVIDSLEALTPIKEYDKDMDDTMQMGIKPKLFGEFFRKYQASNNFLAREEKKAFTLIGINQLREKIGCFHYSSRVLLSNGQHIKIGHIVDEKLEVEVMSYNEESKKLEPKKITNWFNNGEQEEEFLTLTTDRPQGNGRGYIASTPNHKILTPKGYVEAQKLKVGDKVIQTLANVLTIDKVREQVLIGSMLGDGSVRKLGNTYQFRISHCEAQRDYLRFKASFFNGKTHLRDKDRAYLYDSLCSIAFEEYYEDWYIGTRKSKIPKDIELSPLALAIWYQDDGSLSNQSKKSIEIYTNRFGEEGVNTLIKALEEQHNIKAKYRIKDGEYVLTFGRKETKQFFDVIGKYIHPDLFYKLGEYVPTERVYLDTLYTPDTYGRIMREATILEIGVRKRDNKRDKYDIEVEDNHNYIVNDILVHNSYGNPEYSPGGRAKDFASSLNIRLRGGDWLAQGKGENKEIVGQIIKFKIDKNKTYKRMQSGEFDFYFAENENEIPVGHNDNFKSIIVQGVAWGIIERGGAWYYLDREKDLKFMGLDNLIAYFRENPELVGTMKEQILKLADNVK